MENDISTGPLRGFEQEIARLRGIIARTAIGSPANEDATEKCAVMEEQRREFIQSLKDEA